MTALPALVPLTDGHLLPALVSYPVGWTEPLTSLTPDDLDTHLARYGDRPRFTHRSGARLISALAATELDGCGGGHFPVAAKWRAHRDAGGGGVVVANGAESEPASAKDAALLQLRPHLVLDGLVCAAEALGARSLVVWLHEGASSPFASVTRALAERRAAGLAEPIVYLATAPRRYVAGESSAIVRALSGGPARPEFRRVPTAVRGVHGRPTLIQNVETLARTAMIARSASGRPAAARLFTIATAGERTVIEVAGTTTLTQAIDSVLGPRPHQAALVGGYGGTWVSWQVLSSLPANERAARAQGLSLGAGVLLPLGTQGCGLAEAAAIAQFLAAESARQCGPCRFGLRASAEALTSIVDLRARSAEVGRLAGMLGEVSGRGACHHPDGAVRMIRSAMATFASDVHSHVAGSGCRHGGDDQFFPTPVGD